MFKNFLASVRVLFILTVLTGVLYPLTLTLVAQVLFPFQANGSLLVQNTMPVGSLWLAQAPPDDGRYFEPRPSAIGYSPLPSGGSNLSFTSASLQTAVAERRARWQSANTGTVPAELLFASGSGLDPHLTPEAARWQASRVASARGLTDAQRAQLDTLITQHTESPQWGFLGQARVNILRLNLALDNLFSTP